jgi:hypothetical protein
MFGIENLTGPTKALAQVGLVLLEAVILYVLYGGLSSLFSEWITDAIRGE